MHALFDLAARDGVERRTLVDAFPDRVPYRDEAGVRRLLEAHGMTGGEIVELPDCLVACRRKPPQVTGALAAAPDDWIIRLERVSLRYPGAERDAVHGLELAIPRGSVYGILGPNGAGKTTTMSLLAGLLVPREGAIRWADGPDARARRRTIGSVPQSLALCPKLTARENLDFFGGLYGLGGGARDRRVEQLLGLVGLSEHAAARIETFSSGMLRRLNLAAGLVHDPGILLLDEPTVGIDPQSRNRIFDLVLEQKRRGRTVLLTTQYLEEASRLCDRVVIMDRGVVVVEGAPREIVARTGTFRLEFDLESPSDRLVEAVRGLVPVSGAAVVERVLVVTARDGAGAMQVLEELPALARAEGARVALRRVAEPSLESVFLDLTGRSIRDPEAT